VEDRRFLILLKLIAIGTVVLTVTYILVVPYIDLAYIQPEEARQPEQHRGAPAILRSKQRQPLPQGLRAQVLVARNPKGKNVSPWKPRRSAKKKRLGRTPNALPWQPRRNGRKKRRPRMRRHVRH